MNDMSERDLVLDAAQKCRDAQEALNLCNVSPMKYGIHMNVGDTPGGYWHAEQALRQCLTYLLPADSAKRVSRLIELMIDSDLTVVEALKREGQDFAVKHASALGEEQGVNAAAWWKQDALGGRSSGDTRDLAQKIIKGIEDGDPEVSDALPRADLSGQWADTMNSERLFEECCEVAGIDPDANREAISDEVCEAYEDAFDEFAESRVYDYCRGFLSEHLS